MGLKRLVHESKPVATLAVLIVAQCVDRMVYTQILYDRTKFFVYFANIVLPLASLVASGAIAIYNKVNAKGSTPAESAPRPPHYRFILMAFLSTLYNLLSIASTPHINGYVADVLSELGLPFIIALSYVVLSTGFKHGHALGVLLALYGSLATIAPELNGDQSRSGWLRLYSISTTQQALLALSAFKQLGLQHGDSGFYVANPWISFYQILWGLASLCCLDASPLMSWSDLFAFMCELCVHVLDKPLTCDWNIFGWFLASAACHVIISNSVMVSLKAGKSMVPIIALAAGLPLAYTLYLLPTLSGIFTSATIYDGIIVLGFIAAQALWVIS